MKEVKKSLETILRSSGFLMPKTDDEIKKFIKENEDNFRTPSDFENPLEILKGNRTKIISHIQNSVISDDMENLARAARDGQKISDEELRKMKEDRDNAEKGK
jgi:hypothetical protein